MHSVPLSIRFVPIPLPLSSPHYPSINSLLLHLQIVVVQQIAKLLVRTVRDFEVQIG